jgi:hypothetical protein
MVAIVSRAEWGAAPPKRLPTQITLPTPELWLHHTAGSEPDGPDGPRRIQQYHQDVKGWNDIAYSFVIDRAGTVFEGRGAGVQGGHTRGHNRVSHAICVVGNYDVEPVRSAAVQSVAALVAFGHRRGWWPARLTGGHRDASGASTSCPGRNLHMLIPDVNVRAGLSREGAVVEPVLYARRGTPDFLSACAAVAASGRGSVTCDLDGAVAALAAGSDVVAVGGPAARELPSAVSVVGDGAVGTLLAVGGLLGG